MADERGTGLAWTGRPDDDELDPTLYSGTAGIVLALLEGYQHFGEHRASPGTLAPRTGWAMGNAGIIRELLRYARIQEGGDPGYAVAWPDHPPVILPRSVRPG